jgi:exodeoxyribonuclease-3
MIIATFNINEVNGRLPILVRWLKETQPDVACLQELKAPDERFPAAALAQAGYGAVWHGQKAYNGVAILARDCKPRELRRGLPGDPDDDASRYLEAEVGGLTIGCLYLPNGNPSPGLKFDYNLRWFGRLAAYAQHLLAQEKPVVLAGDFNVIPSALDAAHPNRWVRNALFFPESRAAYENLLAQGWTDALRELFPGAAIYTFWDYFRNAFGRNDGIRIDHILLSRLAASQLAAGGIDRAVRGWEKSSDHAPAWIEVAD